MGYCLFCYELATLCMYGRINNHFYFFLGSIVWLLSILLFTTMKVMNNREYGTKKSSIGKSISIIIILAITLFYGVEIYKSATNYGGKLAWTTDRIKNEKSIKFEHNNIYKFGVEGIFKDINKDYRLPKKLYMASDFKLTFNADGIITAFDTFVYGTNADGKEETFLITYDKNKARKITVWLNGYAGADYDEDKLLEPLIQTVNAISMQQAVSKWNEHKFGLNYYGKRNWGYNTEGIININKKGKEQYLEIATSEIIGYTVSIFVLGKEKEIIPARYNLIENPSWGKVNQHPVKEEQQAITNEKEQFFLSKEVGYQLNLMDKALGSSYYTLSKTTNKGQTWEVINADPFNGGIGSVAGITFINNQLGFIGAIHPSGTNSVMYRTIDGGLTFNEVNYNLIEVKLESGLLISPFDSPTIPYEKDGILHMLVGQGADADYNGNSSVLYQSKDDGETWEYVKEVNSSSF